MTRDAPRDARNPVNAAAAFFGIVVGVMFIVGAVYLGANPNYKSVSPPSSSSARTGTGSETTGLGSMSR